MTTPMTTTMTTLYQLYRQHIDELKDERETVLEAQRLFPYTWQAIYSLMNQTIKQKELQNDHS